MTIIKQLFRPTLVAFGLASLSSLVACKDYLEVEPTAVDTSEAVFSTTSGAYSAVIGAYAPLAGDVAYGSRISTYFPYDSEDFLNSPTGIDAGDGRRGIARYGSIASNVEVRNPWNALYRGIERANICIKYIPGMDQYKGGTDQAAVQRLYGEALTLRAQYYFELVRNWGDVPAPYEPTVTGQDLNLPRSKRNDILDRMIDDLALAAPLVPWRSAATNDERITKGAVKALRARLALYRAGYYYDPVSARVEQANATDQQKFYGIVRSECADLMANRGEHDLNSSFEEPFRSICEYRRDNKHEIMFEVAMGGTANGSSTDSKLGYANGPRVTATSAAYGAITQGSLVATPTYFYAFDSTDTRRDVTLAPYSIDAGPKRLHTNVVTIYDGKFRREWSSNTTLRASAAQGLGYNWPLIRFSDVLLMFAEAQNELAGGPDVPFGNVTARQALMEVRLRGFGGNATRAGVVPATKAGFFEAVATERNLEFGGEGIRKYDLIRWNRLGSTFQNIKATLNTWTAALNTQRPQYIYYTTPTTYGPLRILNSYYKPSATVAAHAGTTRVDWITVNAANTSGITTTRINDIASAYTEAHQLLPIPAESINLNPKLTQNPGY